MGRNYPAQDNKNQSPKPQTKVPATMIMCDVNDNRKCIFWGLIRYAGIAEFRCSLSFQGRI